MLVTLDVKESAIDEFMQLLKHFSGDDIVVENRSFINEKESMHQALKSIDDGEKMISDDDLWLSTEKVINN